MVDRARRQKQRVVLSKISSFQKYFICNNCCERYPCKLSLATHIKVCEPKWIRNLPRRQIHIYANANLTEDIPIPTPTEAKKGTKTSITDIPKPTTVAKKGIITSTKDIPKPTKVAKKGTDTSTKDIPKPTPTVANKCAVCDTTYNHNWELNHHLRREHYNLLAQVPCRDLIKVSEVWYERVHNNSDIIFEMNMIALNTIVMRPLLPGKPIKERNQPYVKLTDISLLYPKLFKRVQKTDFEMKMKSCNKVIMRPLLPETPIKVRKELFVELKDISHLYPNLFKKK